MKFDLAVMKTWKHFTSIHVKVIYFKVVNRRDTFPFKKPFAKLLWLLWDFPHCSSTKKMLVKKVTQSVSQRGFAQQHDGGREGDVPLKLSYIILRIFCILMTHTSPIQPPMIPLGSPQWPLRVLPNNTRGEGGWCPTKTVLKGVTAIHIQLRFFAPSRMLN